MRNASDANSSWNSAAVSSEELAITVPDGTPLTTSSAWFGPDSTAKRCALPISASNTSTGRRPLPSSAPFEQMTMGNSASTTSASARATPRMRFEGVTIAAARARRSASLYDGVATIPSCSSTSER